MRSLVVYSTSWCGPCIRLKAQLDRLGVVYDEVDIEVQPAAEEYVKSVNDGSAIVPTVVLPNGGVLTNPTLPELLAGLEASA